MTDVVPAIPAHEVEDRLTGLILSRLRQALALYLWDHRAVRVSSEDPFTLASGNRSPIYVDCRRVISDPAFMRLYTGVAALILDRKEVAVDVVAGGETAGIPYGAVLAQSLGCPFVYVRKKPKGYGTSSRVEGDLADGSRVLLVEDLITDGGSKLGFLDALEAVGAQVADVVVLFDRQQGGESLLAERGVRLHAVTDRKTAFAVGNSSGLMTETDQLSCEEYFRDAKAWHDKRGYAWHDAG
ncbi:MAG: orotate phosphoribosyltransferase [Acidobacteriota bacterium]